MLKANLTLLLTLVSGFLFSQVPSYYNDVNLNLTGQALQNELAAKITNSQTTVLTYTPGVWDALKQTDLVPGSNSRVVLIYGYNDSDGVTNTDRTRGVNDNGGGTSDWNREHVYPKSLANPNLGTTGAGADAHNLRPADVSRNSNRGSRKFADGAGNSGVTSQGHWYPGDEFKGDVARMMMYMYLRYGSRCLPSNVGVGTINSSDANMLNLFLEWNVEDPVSDLELQRNPVLEGLQGNRNPFIDNPAFATEIWGGPQAEDRFAGGGSGGGGGFCSSGITNFPYSESFESDFGGWSQSGGDDFDWTRRSGSTPSSNTGPSSAQSGSFYAYMESSAPNFSSKRAILRSPCYNLSGLSQATFSFRYHLYGRSDMGSLELQATTNGGTWTTLWSRSGNQGNSWQTANVGLSAYVGQGIQLRFNGVTGTTWQGDMAIDAISLSTSGVSAPADVDVSLRITLDNYPEETSWVIRDGSGTTVASGGTYGSQPDGATVTVNEQLTAGCYTLVVSDTYGDGICCTYGSGSYTLTNESNGQVLASGGSFGSTESKSFCVGNSSRLDVDAEHEELAASIAGDLIYPNPATDIVFVKVKKASVYQLVSQAGKVVKAGEVHQKIDLSDVERGIYFLMVQSGDHQVVKKLVIE